MERQYQVLARKRRPRQFDEVVGQRAVVRTLRNALEQNRIAHAYCFSGIRGVGKTTIARLLAKGLNCRSVDGPTATPCGECESCVEIMEGRSMDVFERDAASDRRIDDIRELIEIARYAPSRDRYKVMILDEAHMLTTEASNALLKVIEEPPEYIVFALATTEPNRILPTILSRCQHYQLGRISQREIEEYLGKTAAAENIDISADGLALVATAADGSLRDSLSLLDKLIAFAGDTIDESTVVDLLGLVDRVLLFRAVDLIADQDVAGVLGLVNEMVEQGVDLYQFTVDLLVHFRNLLVVRTVPEPGEILHLPAGDLETLGAQAGRFEVDDLDRAFSLLAASEDRIKVAEQPRYHVEVALSRLARMPSLQPIEELIAALGDGGSGSGSPGDGGGSRRSRNNTSQGSLMRGAQASPAVTSRPGRTENRATPASRRKATAAMPTESREPAPAETAEPTPAETAPAAAARPVPARSEEATPAPGPPAYDEPPLPPEPDAPPVEQGRPMEPTAAAKPAASEPKPTAGDAAAPDADGANDEPTPSSGILGRVQAKLAETHPLVAQSLGRTSGIEVAGDALVFRFPPTAGLFADRFRDPEILPALRAAAEAALGRSVVPRVEIDEKATAGDTPSRAAEAPAAAPTPAAASPPDERPEHDDSSRGTAPVEPLHTIPPEPSAPDDARAAAPAAANGNGAGASAPRPASDEFRQQVEQLPLVQGLLDELKGTVLSVEEL